MPSNRALTVIALALLTLSACSAPDQATIPAITIDHSVLSHPTFPGAPVLLISIDTLRADHLGCYGYHRDTSPNLDRFSHQAILFEETIAQAPSTLPSHASIFSSLLPSQHQAYFMRKQRLPDSVQTLAEQFSKHGYRTAAFTGGGQMAPEYGLDQGFENYSVLPSKARMIDTVEAGLHWIEQHQSEPFFLFLHTYEVHHPYTPSPENLALFDERGPGDLPRQIDTTTLRQINHGERTLEDGDLEYIIASYDAEIRSVDSALRMLFEQLEQSGLFDQAVIVVTSDHGEEFGEHGWVGWHSHTLFDELLRVPLLIKTPSSWAADSRVRSQARSLDIAPSLLALTGLQVPDAFLGSNILNRIAGKPIDQLPAVSTQDTGSNVDISSLRLSNSKLYPSALLYRDNLQSKSRFKRAWWRFRLSRRPFHIFDLDQDPGETSPTRSVGAEAKLVQLLTALQEQRPTQPPAPARISESTIRELEALGYVD